MTARQELLAYSGKKLWVLHKSFLDFGPAAHANEGAWFIAGGMGQVLKTYNNMFFNLANGCDFPNGITLNAAPAGSTQDSPLVFADLGMVVQDAKAHACAFDWKGSSAVKRCPLCLNIVSEHCTLVRDPTRGTIPIWITYIKRFRLNSDKTFRSMQRRLQDIAVHHPKEVKGEGTRFRIRMEPAQPDQRLRAQCGSFERARF